MARHILISLSNSLSPTLGFWDERYLRFTRAALISLFDCLFLKERTDPHFRTTSAQPPPLGPMSLEELPH